MSNYIVKISRLALTTLNENILFLKKFDVNYSIKLRERIIKGVDDLVIFSHSNPIYRKTNYYIYRKKIVNNRYIIVYTINKNIIYVFYILDGKPAYDRYLKSLR